MPCFVVAVLRFPNYGYVTVTLRFFSCLYKLILTLSVRYNMLLQNNSFLSRIYWHHHKLLSMCLSWWNLMDVDDQPHSVHDCPSSFYPIFGSSALLARRSVFFLSQTPYLSNWASSPSSLYFTFFLDNQFSWLPFCWRTMCAKNRIMC